MLGHGSYWGLDPQPIISAAGVLSCTAFPQTGVLPAAACHAHSLLPGDPHWDLPSCPSGGVCCFPTMGHPEDGHQP